MEHRNRFARRQWAALSRRYAYNNRPLPGNLSKDLLVDLLALRASHANEPRPQSEAAAVHLERGNLGRKRRFRLMRRLARFEATAR